MYASTSAGSSMRIISLAVRRQMRSAGSVQGKTLRTFTSSSISRKTDSPTGSNATPARDHRRQSAASAGGPEVDAVTREARNSSTASTIERQNSIGQQLTDLTRKIGRDRRVATGREGGLQALQSIGQSGAQAARMMPMLGRQQAQPQAQQTGQSLLQPQVEHRVSSPALAPSGYSITHVPRKHDPTIKAFINNLMRDGKKATTTTYVLDALRFMAKSLHADPLPAFREAVERASPLIRMQTRKQGGKNTQVPLALFPRQSRRRGIVAIIEASKKRSDGEISVRLAKEIMAVLDGSSAAITRKDDAHKLATVNRGNTGVRV